MRTILPYLTPALLAVIAALLGVIAWKMPATAGDYRAAMKNKDNAKTQAVLDRAILTSDSPYQFSQPPQAPIPMMHLR